LTVEYVFPEVYIAEVEGPRYLCRVDESEFYIVDNSLQFSCSLTLGLVPFEESIKFIDLLQASTTRTIAVVKEDPKQGLYKGILIPENTRVCLQEIQGSIIYTIVKEGDTVEVGDIVAYTISEKLEVRKIKSLCSGLVALIVDKPWEEPRKTIMVIASEYRSITARKSAGSRI
jgi:hypothetical protein